MSVRGDNQKLVGKQSAKSARKSNKEARQGDTRLNLYRMLPVVNHKGLIITWSGQIVLYK